MDYNIRDFYNQVQFPGKYTMTGLQYHDDEIKNKYLAQIASVINDNVNVLDLGCGTGLISNLLANKYPTSNFTGVDFSDSIYYARKFSAKHNIKNTKFIKQDILNFSSSSQYDVVIAQGVLHHIPEYKKAIEKTKALVKEGGYLVVGLYHPMGKIAKRLFNITYNSNTLYLDQEKNPFELSFSGGEVKDLFADFFLESAFPSTINSIMAVHALFNYTNGGLVTYVFKKPANK